MGITKAGLDQVPGLEFHKLLGSGAENGFSIWPDFSTYIFLGVWTNRTYADAFFEDHAFFNELRSRSQRWWTVCMLPLKVHGQWSGSNPFRPVEEVEEGLFAVITRATLYPSKVISFWKNVPGVSGDLKGQSGLLYAKGIGEYPVFMQATISFWETKQRMVDYAYKSKLHSEVIRKARTRGWFSEELFANFRPIATDGNFDHPLITKFPTSTSV